MVMKRLTLKELVDKIGPPRVAVELELSLDTVRAWRLGVRHPGSKVMRKALCDLGKVNYNHVDWGDNG